MAKQVVVEERAYDSSFRSTIAALAIGAGVGFLGWILTLVFKYGLIDPIFCRSADASSVCVNSTSIAWIFAFVIVSLVGLFSLVRAGVFRPLLVVIAAIVALWMVSVWFIGAAWWVGLLWSTLLFALAYALFTWLASLSSFVVSLIFMVIAVFLIRMLAIA